MNELPQAEREILEGAVRRPGLFIVALIPIGTAVAVWRWGGAMGVAFACGGVLAYLNYRWIVAVVDTLIRTQPAKVSRRTYVRLFLPLVLLAVALYAILSRSWLSVGGFLGGLFLLVVGVLMELVYEMILAVRH